MFKTGHDEFAKFLPFNLSKQDLKVKYRLLNVTFEGFLMENVSSSLDKIF